MSKQLPETKDVETPKVNDYQWISNPKGIPELYTNYIHASWTLFDVRILLGQLRPGLNSEDFTVEEQGAVSFSWIHAKIIASALMDLVASYESVNGEIPRVKIAPRNVDSKK